jgi:hypothetical protein
VSTSLLTHSIAKIISRLHNQLPKRAVLALRVSAVVFLAIFSLAPSVYTKGIHRHSYPLDIDILGADNPGKKAKMLVAEGGWPLTIQLSTDDALGIARSLYPPILPDSPTFPVHSNPRGIGLLLFSNPDGLDPNGIFDPAYNLSFFCGTNYQFNSAVYCANPVPDETYLEFEVGTNEPLPINALYPYQGAPNFGLSERIPGLVILSDSGIGNVYEADLEHTNTCQGFTCSPGYKLTSPRQARNLAAYIDSVAYLLRDYKGKTVITASWNAPRGIITPYVERDADLELFPPTMAGNPALIRINGGDIQQVILPSAGAPLDDVMQALGFVVKMRIFVVNGDAPTVVTDLNGDGDVDAADLSEEYTLLSDEKTILLKLPWGPIEFFGVAVDLDNNNKVGEIVLPASAGGLGRIPK